MGKFANHARGTSCTTNDEPDCVCGHVLDEHDEILSFGEACAMAWMLYEEQDRIRRRTTAAREEELRASVQAFSEAVASFGVTAKLAAAAFAKIGPLIPEIPQRRRWPRVAFVVALAAAILAWAWVEGALR